MTDTPLVATTDPLSDFAYDEGYAPYPNLDDMLATRYLKVVTYAVDEPMDDERFRIHLIAYNGKDYYAGTAVVDSRPFLDLQNRQLEWVEAEELRDRIISALYITSDSAGLALETLEAQTEVGPEAAEALRTQQAVTFTTQELLESAVDSLRTLPRQEEIAQAVANLLDVAAPLIEEAHHYELHTREHRIASAIAELALAVL